MLTLEMYAGIIYPSKLIIANGAPHTHDCAVPLESIQRNNDLNGTRLFPIPFAPHSPKTLNRGVPLQ